MGVFAILWLLFRRMRPAVMGAAFALLNFTIYIQARIAMLDGFLAAFTVLAIAAMLWAMTAPPGRVWPRWMLSAMLFGLAVAAKWVAAPYLVFAALAFLIVRWRDARTRNAAHRDAVGQRPAALARPACDSRAGGVRRWSRSRPIS